MKINSQKIFELDDELIQYYQKYKISSSIKSTLFYIIFHVIFYGSALYIIWMDENIDRVFTIQYYIYIKYYHHAPFTLFHVTGWVHLVILLYVDVSCKYINILNSMLIEMNKYKGVKNYYLFQISTTIKKFYIDKFMLNNNIYNLLYFIIVNIISLIIMLLMLAYTICCHNFNGVLIALLSQIFILLLYLLYVIKIIFIRHKTKCNVLRKLNNWKCNV